MASDMFFAGIETTGNAIGFLLYNLAVNQVIHWFLFIGLCKVPVEWSRLMSDKLFRISRTS